MDNEKTLYPFCELLIVLECTNWVMLTVIYKVADEYLVM
jgi:hypothetical protein